MSVLGARALEYLANGWSVIPAQPKGKKPMIEWAAYSQRRPTAAEVQQWWGKWPNANIALVTGKVSGLIAVDIDTNRGGSPDPIYKSHPTDMISRTGSGGYHLFYRYPDDTENVPNRVGSNGVDVRGDSGYVIVPPSVHANGRLYEALQWGEPGYAPDWVLHPENDTESAAGGKWLSDLLSGTVPGGRNDACAKLAGYFASKGMALEVALILVEQWNQNNDPPLSKAEITTTVRSVYRTALRRDKSKPKQKSGPATEVFPLVGLGSFMAQWGDTAVSWDVGDWLPARTIAFLISPPGGFKTWLTLDLALSVAGGTDFLGQFPVENPGPVLIIQQEDFHGQTAERLAIIAASKYGLKFQDKEDDEFEVDVIPELPIFLHTERKLRFDDPDVIRALEEQISTVRPKLVIIDPLYSAGSTDDYMAKTAEQMMVLKGLRDRYKTSFVIVHHTKKTAEGSDRQGLWGSQFLNAFLETGWQVRKVEDDDRSITIHRHFKVKGAPEPLQLTFDISTVSPYRYKIDVVPLDEVTTKDKVDIIGLLREHGPLTQAELTDKSGVAKSTISRYIAKLIKNGILIRSGNKIELLSHPDF